MMMTGQEYGTLEADRYGVHNWAAAAISTTLGDYGINSLEDHINIVDYHKVWRARSQLRRASYPINNDEEIIAIFF